jgi:putative Mg2+ transporter-C (MgtC) family protein
MIIEEIGQILTLLWGALRATPDISLVMDLGLAIVLGFLFGYERSYHGRAAGMRTYGLVCMVACAVTSLSMHPNYWLQGHALINPAFMDPTRTIQGIIMGVGFLGGGIIMQNGVRISGLTTAASIWAVAAVGILVGAEMYLAALMMTLLAEGFIMMGSRFDMMLPARRPIAVTLQFRSGIVPKKIDLDAHLASLGYTIAGGSIMIQRHNDQFEWRFVATSIKRRRDSAIIDLADALPLIEGVENIHLTRARN